MGEGHWSTDHKIYIRYFFFKKPNMSPFDSIQCYKLVRKVKKTFQWVDQQSVTEGVSCIFNTLTLSTQNTCIYTYWFFLRVSWLLRRMFWIYSGKSDLFNLLTFVSITASVMCWRLTSVLILNLTVKCYRVDLSHCDGESSVFIIFIVDSVGESRTV